jgi:GNAT superfamily N-acetyltransferase
VTTLQIDRLTHRDLPDALRLSTEAGWNQTGADWKRLLDLSPGACFGGRLAGRLVATATLASYGGDLASKYSWIGMVIVERACRRRGFGTALLRQALEHGLARGDSVVGLDATDLGRPVYLQHGFVDVAPIERWLGRLAPESPPPGIEVETLAGTVPDEVLAFDRSAVGLDRGHLLRHLAADPDVLLLVARDRTRVQGVAFLRSGREHRHLGPVVAEPGAGLDGLLVAAAARLAGGSVLVDALRNDLTAGRLAASGLIVQRRLQRMTYGRPQGILIGARVVAATAFEWG